MVCSHCSQSGHTIVNCPIIIENRAQCIFANGYDPKFDESNALMHKYWFTLPSYVYIVSSRYDLPNNEYYVIEKRMNGERKMVYIRDNITLHASHVVSYGHVPEGYRVSAARMEILAPSHEKWSKIPAAWFDRTHPSDLGSECSRWDSAVTLRKINDRLQELNRALRASLPINVDNDEFAQDVGPMTIDELNTEVSESPSTPRSRVTYISSNDTGVEETHRASIARYEEISRRNQERNTSISQNIVDSGVLTADTESEGTNVEEEVQVSDATTCGICWDELKESNVMVTKCGHKFCCDCILSHFQAAQGNNCPLCRTEYAKRVEGWLPPQSPERPRRGPGRPRRQARRRGPDSTPTNRQVIEAPPANVTVRTDARIFPINNINHDIDTASNEGRITNEEREAIQRAVTDATQGRVDVFAMGLQALLGNTNRR